MPGFAYMAFLPTPFEWNIGHFLIPDFNAQAACLSYRAFLPTPFEWSIGHFDTWL